MQTTMKALSRVSTDSPLAPSRPARRPALAKQTYVTDAHSRDPESARSCRDDNHRQIAPARVRAERYATGRRRIGPSMETQRQNVFRE